jgi:PTS system mannose-specific IIC component
MDWWVELLAVALLGSVIGLDVVSFPQAMLSRPVVASTLAGALVGNATQGLVIGAVLELFALETLPVGASRYPEGGSAAVIGGALFAVHAPDRPGALALATLAALLAAWIGGYSMILVRKLNAHWARAQLPALERGEARAVVGLQLVGLTADLLRGFLLTASLYALVRAAMNLALPQWRAPVSMEYMVVTALVTTVAGAALWRLHHAEPAARRLFATGVLVACLALLLR